MKIPEILLIEVERRAGSLAEVLEVVGRTGLLVDGLQSVKRTASYTVWELTTDIDEDFDWSILECINDLPHARLLGTSDRVFVRHGGGKIRTVSRVTIDSEQVLRDIYTPGVARVCLAIRDNESLARRYTALSNTVAVVTDGSAVLGLGNIGAVAGMPVMEGKAALFEQLAGISAVPILLGTSDPEVIVDTIERIAPSFGAIQLEDIAAPRCFEIERELVRRLDRPVLHDDQHGTAVVTLAALLSATREAGIDLGRATLGQIGLGAAGIGIARLLLHHGVGRVIGADQRDDALAQLEVLGGSPATLAEVMAQADVVVATTGVRGLIKPQQVRPGQLILALTNPDPEIEPAVALAHGARFAADGAAVNNVLAFPGLFRGALDAGAPRFTMEMLCAAAQRLSTLAEHGQLVPSPLDRSVHAAVGEAVRDAAVRDSQTPLLG